MVHLFKFFFLRDSTILYHILCDIHDAHVTTTFREKSKHTKMSRVFKRVSGTVGGKTLERKVSPTKSLEASSKHFLWFTLF